MDNRDRALDELEALVEANREAFERAQRLLAAMKQPRQRDSSPHADCSESADELRRSDGSTIGDDPGSSSLSRWLDLPQLVRVELGPKEAPKDFVESALSGCGNRTWRARESGPQTIRLRFAAPQCIRGIRLVFEEHQTERTQEFVLSWLQQGSTEYREILRQQYVFSPKGSHRESEDYEVELNNLVAIELHLIPALSNKQAFASLTQWSLANHTVSRSGRSHLLKDVQGDP